MAWLAAYDGDTARAACSVLALFGVQTQRGDGTSGKLMLGDSERGQASGVCPCSLPSFTPFLLITARIEVPSAESCLDSYPPLSRLISLVADARNAR